MQKTFESGVIHVVVHDILTRTTCFRGVHGLIIVSFYDILTVQTCECEAQFLRMDPNLLRESAQRLIETADFIRGSGVNRDRIRFFMGNGKPQTAKCHVTTALRSRLQFTFEPQEGLPAVSDFRQGFFATKNCTASRLNV